MTKTKTERNWDGSEEGGGGLGRRRSDKDEYWMNMEYDSQGKEWKQDDNSGVEWRTRRLKKNHRREWKNGGNESGKVQG